MKTKKQPVYFFGHGSPMNVIEENDFTRALSAIGKKIKAEDKPTAVLVVSAHWASSGKTLVCSSAHPEQIYDFYGFPEELYRVKYRPAGAPGVAQRVYELASEPPVIKSDDWGLDHGAWSLLTWLFPQADLPVLQLSLDMSLPLSSHVKIGQSLRALREEGVLILGSGNVTHNLGEASFDPRPTTPAWAKEFDEAVVAALESRSEEKILALAKRPDFRQAHPYPDHFLPMLYVFGASDPNDALEYLYQGYQNGSLSMRAWKYGQKD